MSTSIHLDRSVAVMGAYFLGLGVGAHALDETMGNPLQTKISKKALYIIGFSSLSAAALVGLYYVATVSILILPFVLVESFLAVAYNLEMFQKRFHSDLVFALSWGSIPFLTAYFVNSLSLSPGIILMAIGVGTLTLVQRTLSTQARFFRRKLQTVEGLSLEGGDRIPMTTRELIAPAERSLKALTVTIFLVAIALLLVRIHF